MITKIKELRVKLDGLTQLTKSLDPLDTNNQPVHRTREISLTITSLELSKMFLGKVLKELGNANPYPESKNPLNEKIEPAADKFVSDANFENFYEMTHIQMVNLYHS